VLICCDTYVSRKYLRSNTLPLGDQLETPIGIETLVFGEIHNDGSAVDAKADVFDRVVRTVREWFCLDSVRRGGRVFPFIGTSRGSGDRY
jgi:hypothetical protein